MSTASVVVPVYNSEKYIKRTVDALLAQTRKLDAIYIVDDGSEDQTYRVLSEAYGSNVVVNLIAAPHSGLPAKSRNLGWVMSQTNYIAFCDADDVWYPRKLENDLKMFDARPDIDMLFSMCDYAGRCTPLGRKWSYGPDMPEGLIGESLLYKKNPVMMSSVVMKRDTLVACSGFSEEPSMRGVEDYDLWIRVSRLGSIYFRRARSHQYAVRELSVSSDSEQMNAGVTAIAQKYGFKRPDGLRGSPMANLLRSCAKSLRVLTISSDR